MNKFKVDKVGLYKDRSGRKIEVIYTDRQHMKRIVGLYNAEVWLFHSCGHYNSTHADSTWDLIAPWLDEPAVGSYEWTCALPDGAKIKWHTWSDRSSFLTKVNGKWNRAHSSLNIPAPYDTTGWVLYKEPILRQLTMAEWKERVGQVVVNKETQGYYLVVSVVDTVHLAGWGVISTAYILEHFTFADGTPCGVLE